MADKLQVFFDGACVVCATEVQHYQKLNRQGQFEFVDISHPAFRVEDYGLDRAEVQMQMHSKDSNGRIYVGVDSFVQIWRRLPNYQWAANLAEKVWVRPVLKVGYHAFTKIRPFLPRRRGSLCTDGTCVLK